MLLTIRVLRAMRKLDSDWVSPWRRKADSLYPPFGTIGVGGADFDYLLKAVVGESYLRALRKRNGPSVALEVAKKDGKECVKTWNERTCKTRAAFGGYYTLQRWEKAGESEAEFVHRVFLSYL